jgi:hypothetical protein
MAGETKINGMGLLNDIRQQWGLLGTRQKKLNANEIAPDPQERYLEFCIYVTYTGGRILLRATAAAGSRELGNTTLKEMIRRPFSNGFLNYNNFLKRSSTRLQQNLKDLKYKKKKLKGKE